MSPDSPSRDSSQGLESTGELLARMRAGDRQAAERLLARYLPGLRRFARGRVPACARAHIDTDDLVQSSFVRALGHLHRFEHRGDGAFLAFLRTILVNQLRDAARHAARHPAGDIICGELACTHPTPLEELVGVETLERYEAALRTLPRRQRECVVLRIEFGLDYAHIAEITGRPSVNAVRLVVGRALAKLAEHMRAGGVRE